MCITVLQEATRTKNLHKLRAAVALMRTNQLADKVKEDAVLAEDMLAKMEQIDEMKVGQLHVYEIRNKMCQKKKTGIYSV